MSRRIIFLINPISGTGNKADLQELIRLRMLDAGISYALYPTAADGDYRFLEPLMSGFTEIVICGGDGTINNVVQALRQYGLPFGLLPSGSGNGLGYTAGIPKDPEQALNIIINGTAQTTDAFTINGRFACMLCGLGFDALVAHDFASAGKRGLTTYIRKIVRNFWSAETYPFILEKGSDRLELDAYFISIANSNQFGNRFTIAPKASLKDGLLDIVVMLHQSKWSVLLQTFRQVTGLIQLQNIEQVNAETSVLYMQTDLIKIHNPGGAPLHIDGDPAVTAKQLDVKIMPGAFRLICP